MKHDVYDTGSIAGRSRTDEQSAAPKASADQEEMRRKVEAAGRPGPAHKALEPLVGNWQVEVRCWMKPGEAPMVSQGTSKISWTLNGRFLEEEFHGQMMGEPFTGCCVMGYDNTKQVFNSVWMDDMHTSMFVSEGKADSGYKVITLEGKASCPATGRRDIPMKTVLRMLGPDKHVMEMLDGSQDNAKTMEITYTRQ